LSPWYLIAGFLAGNHFDFFPSVKDIKVLKFGQNWCNVTLLSLGLEFSFKKS
jgi:CPA2 family monovalent cation:H+ antiporter-2